MKGSKQLVKRVLHLVNARETYKQLGLQESRNVVRALLANYRNNFVRINGLEQVRLHDHLFIAYSLHQRLRA